MMRIALAQINPTVGDLLNNEDKILDFYSRAQKQGVCMVVFPELAVTGYPPQDLLHKEHFIQDNIKVLNKIVKKIKGPAAVIGFVDSDKKGNLYNAAAVVEDKKIKTIIRKEALPNYGVFDEKRYFQPGANNKACRIKGQQVGISICEDIWIDGGTYKKYAKAGARVIVNISSSPYDVGKLKAREDLLKKRAKETGAYICYVNQVGGQDELVFDGTSIIVNPKGIIEIAGKEFEEDLILADLDIGKQKLPNTIFNQKPQKSTQLQRVYKALVLGTRDYVRKNGFEKVVIGVSGGIDSALVAAIAVEAVGRDKVVGVTMPSRYTSSGTNTDAKALARSLGIALKEIPIEGMFTAYLEALSGEFSGLGANIAEENLQARIRGNLLMALSNKFGWLVLTTGNKSEFAVGYCTLYGDMSGGFAMLKDVPKTTVYELAGLINAGKKGTIPQSILDRAPSAELRANQKDQDSLPDYAVLDRLLKAYVEEHQSLAQMSKKANRQLAAEVIRMVDRSEYKRRQSPPGIKITSRSFDKDWRLPITNKYREF